MTARDFLRLLRRRWYVLAVLLVATVAVAVAMPREAGVYWTRATVVFVPPVNRAQIGNVLEGSDPSLIYFANAVGQTVNDGRQGARLSSSDATLYGSGVRQGHTVTLVNSGGQWLTNYNRPMLSVEVVDTSDAAAAAAMDQVIAQIKTTTQTMQAEAGAPTRFMIRTELAPSDPQVVFIPGNWKRAFAATVAIGIGLSLALTLAADSWLLGRSRRRTRSTAPITA